MSENNIDLKDILKKLKESGIDIKLVGEVARAFNYSYTSGYIDGEKANVRYNKNK